MSKYLGEIFAMAGTNTPTHALQCGGQTLSRSSYPELFTVIGTTYGVGDDDGETFSLPDLRGRVPGGCNTLGGSSVQRLSGVFSDGVNGDAVGNAGGSESHQLTGPQVPTYNQGQATPASPGTSFALPSVDGSTAVDRHNNVQPTLIVLWYIHTGE